MEDWQGFRLPNENLLNQPPKLPLESMGDMLTILEYDSSNLL